MSQKKLLFYLLIFVCISAYAENPKNFKDFPKGSEPGFIGSKLIQRYISSNQSTSPIFYAEACTWFGALRFADATKDAEILQKLENRFIPLLGSNSGAMQTPNHVDNTVFGIVPLKLSQLTGKKSYYDVGIDFADRQWIVPADARPENVDKYNALAERGLSWQTRFWIDDMYMITSIQSQAYLASKDEKYINRAAYEMTIYLDSLQRPNGLFYHDPTAPFFWCRGNGWMAAGMADLLSHLPENNPDRPKILQGYRKMMATLKSYQNEEGLWRQLIDQTDAWTETSGSAMFTYAMITGVKNGLLNEEEYAPIARKAWLALVTYLYDDWVLREVCVGTNVGYTKEYYMNRARAVGDPHGQAALLWCAVALYDIDNNLAPTISSLLYDYGTLSPAFNPEITEYTCKLPAGISSVIPSLTASYGAKVATGTETVDVSSGSGTSIITVTSNDGLTTKTYNVHFSVGNDIDYTNLIINNDFDLAPDADCNPVPVVSGIDGWDTSGIPAWRLLNSSCVAKQFYGWTHNQTLLGTSRSQGINADGDNKHGNCIAWIGGNKAGNTEFEFSQTIDKEQLQAGTYKVQCLLAVGTNSKRTSQRLFANNKVQYFGNSYKYAENKTEGESNSFAGYPEFNERNLKEMAVYITINDEESLKIGVRTSNKEGDGDIPTSQSSPMFKMDYFRLTKIADVNAADATLVNIALSSGSLSFLSETTTYNVLLPSGIKAVKALATANLQDVNVTGVGTVDVSSGSGISSIVVTALDGVTTKTYTINYIVRSTSIDELNKTKAVYFVSNRKLTVRGVDSYTVYAINGMKVASVNANASNKATFLNPGVYIVNTNNAEAFKVIVK